MTNDQLRESNGMCVLKIDGFSMHVNTDPLSASFGYTMFTRSSKNQKYSEDEGRCNYYNHETLHNFVLGIRKLRYPEWAEGNKITHEMTVTGWCDGALEQIANLVSLNTHDKDLLCATLRLKHSPNEVAKNNLQIYAMHLKLKKMCRKLSFQRTK